MEQIVYADVLFIINFSMDFLSLYITGKIMRHRPRLPLLCLSAGLGAVYAVASLVLEGAPILGAAIHLCVAGVLCYISYGGPLIPLCKTVCVFFGVNFLLGGGISVLYYAIADGTTHTVSLPGGSGTVYSDIPPAYLLACAAAVGAFSAVCGRIFTKKRAQRPARVCVYGGGCHVEFESLCDTGNLLCDPYNGRPVIITGYMTVLPILPFDTKELFRTGDLTVLDKVSPQISHRVHVIPSRAVGGTSLLLVYSPDKVTVDGIERDACIGILPTDKNSDFGGYPAITPSVLC